MTHEKFALIDKKTHRARVVIRLSSCLPNPEWALDPVDAQKFVELFKGLPAEPLAHTLEVTAMTGTLPDPLGRPRSGFRGFSYYSPNSESPIADFQVFGRRVLDAGDGRIRKDDTGESLEKMSYKTAPREVRAALNHATAEELTRPDVPGPIVGVLGPYKEVKCAHAPEYVGPGDTFNKLRDKNNCYNYATGVYNQARHSNPAVPGRNNTPRPFSVAALRNALERDKLTFRGMSQPKTCPPAGARYIAAFVRRTASGRPKDIHFLRLDKTGLWSHKDGDDEVKNEDDNRVLIRDLTRAQLNGNCMLAGFYLAHEEHRGLIG